MANPIPGDPAMLRELADNLKRGWSTLHDLRVQTGALQHPNPGWDSDAADAFREAAGDLPKRLGFAEARFWGTAYHLDRYAGELEAAQRDAGKAQEAIERAQRSQRAAADEWDRLRRTEPDSDDAVRARRDLTAANDAIRMMGGSLQRAIQRAHDAATRCQQAIGATVADGLRDDDGLRSRFSADLRALAGLIADNPWLVLAAGPLGPSYQAAALALGFSTTEAGREGLEVASDVVNVLGVAAAVLSFVPGVNVVAIPVGVGLGGLGLIIDGSLYAQGRKDEGDLGLDVAGLLPFGKLGGGAKAGYRVFAEAGAAKNAARFAERAVHDVADTPAARWAMRQSRQLGGAAKEAGIDVYRRFADEMIADARIQAGLARRNAAESVTEVRRFAVDLIPGGIAGWQGTGGIEGLVSRFRGKLQHFNPTPGIPGDPVLMGPAP